jgi:hypothetical protein
MIANNSNKSYSGHSLLLFGVFEFQKKGGDFYLARVTSPLFSFDARGKLGDSIVYSIWKGINYVRAYVATNSSNTVNQQTIRSYFTNGSNAYKAENSGTKAAWNTYATNKKMTGRNAYIGKYVLYLIDHSGVEPTSPFLPA